MCDNNNKTIGNEKVIVVSVKNQETLSRSKIRHRYKGSL